MNSEFWSVHVSTESIRSKTLESQLFLAYTRIDEFLREINLSHEAGKEKDENLKGIPNDISNILQQQVVFSSQEQEKCSDLFEIILSS